MFIRASARLGPVYVHCKASYSRSAAVVGAYLMASGRAANADQAIELLKTLRPGMVVRPEARQALEEFQASCAQC